MTINILNTFDENVARFPDRIALEFLDPPLQRVTYAGLDRLVNQTAGYLLSRGLRPGDRVALQLDKCLEFILLHLATIRLGGISLPLNPAYPPDEIGYFLSDSGARFIFALKTRTTSLRPIISQLPYLHASVFLNPKNPNEFLKTISHYGSGIAPNLLSNPSDTAVIFYTSGTTGRPKGAEITHANLIANLQSLHQAWDWKPEDVLLHALPLFHVHGLFVAFHAALHAGATTQLMREFDAHKVLQVLDKGHCTIFMGVPTMHRRLLDAPDASSFDLSGVRLITSGSDRLPEEVFTGFQETFGHTLVERYGMTETGMICSNPLYAERRMGSVGPPLPGVEVRIVNTETGEFLGAGDIGEVQIRGANVFKGYWRQPHQTAGVFTTDGWFRTGDLGLLEPNGYLDLCGRSKDLIISGGLNIYPPEVERVLADHPCVAACAVIGCPDPEWGERVVAVVVPREPETVSEADLIAFCRERLANYKSPKAVIFIDELPRNAMGKVQKTELRRVLCERSP